MGSLIIYTQTADVYALNRDAVDADREGYVRTASGIKINVQPAGLEYVATIPGGAMGKLYRAFTTYPNVLVGNMIALSGSITISGSRLSVIGREPWYGPLGNTYELLLRLAVD